MGGWDLGYPVQSKMRTDDPFPTSKTEHSNFLYPKMARHMLPRLKSIKAWSTTAIKCCVEIMSIWPHQIIALSLSLSIVYFSDVQWDHTVGTRRTFGKLIFAMEVHIIHCIHTWGETKWWIRIYDFRTMWSRLLDSQASQILRPDFSILIYCFNSLIIC